MFTIALLIFSWHYEQQTDMFLQNAQTLLGLPLKTYHKHIIDLLQRMIDIIMLQMRFITDMISDFYETYFKNNISKVRNDL